MTTARLAARAARVLVRALLTLYPREFRESFGETVIAETGAELEESAALGTLAAVAAGGRAVTDTARGAVIERGSQIERARRTMQNAFISDIRFAARALWRDRSFSAVAVGTLGVGLALCVTVTAFVNAYLVRGLPYPGAERLFNTRYDPEAMSPALMDTVDWRSLHDIVELTISWDLDMFNLRGGVYAEVAEGTWVTEGYNEGFAVRPALGRGFEAADFQTGRPMVAMISHGLWQRRFNGDPNVIGRGIDAYVNDRPNEVETFTVIGVLPQRHWHLDRFTEMLAPLRANGYPYVVRLREGVPPAAAEERMTALARAANPRLPADWRIQLISTHDNYVQTIRPLLVAVGTATGLVLLIACANVGVLLTIRATRRAREMTVRQALGATLGQITRACAAEPLLIGTAALAIGLALAWATIVSVSPLVNHYLGRSVPGGAGALGLDAVTVAAAVAITALAVAVCSLVPIWLVRRTAAAGALAGGPRGGTDGPGQRRARAVLVAIEVAASLTLLVGAGLATQSALRMINVDMGLDADQVIVGRFNLRQRSYPTPEARGAFYERVLARADELGGVSGLAFTNSWPLQQPMTREVGRSDSAAYATRAGIVGVSPAYFGTLGVRLHDGRAFSAADRLGTEPVGVVSATLAQRLWPGGSAVGRQLRIAPPANATTPPLVLNVVGVVGDVRHAHSDEDLADVYTPLLQWPGAAVFAYLKVPGDPTAAETGFRRLLASVDPDVGLAAPRPLAEILDLQRAGLRLLGYLLAVFSAFAAALALVGIYGVIAYTVKQREREIAVRLAIGADRALITRMFVGHGAVVLGVGLVAGIGGAVALGRVLQAQLFGVEPADPIVIAAMTAAFALCGLVAVAWPARSAAAVDPATALKE